MTLEENIKIVLSLIDEYAPSSTNLYTEDEDIQNKKIDINQIDKSVEKIIKLKDKYNIADEPAKGCNIDEINRKIEKINMKLQ